jgi:hypothetical protein
MRKSVLLRTVSIGVVSVLGVLVAQQRAPDVDLTLLNRPDELADEPSDTELGGGISSGQKRESPLSLRLLRVDPSSCEAGEPITYDVALKNVTGQDLRIPVSVDKRDAGTSDERVLFPAMSLGLGIFRSGELVDAGDTLYGNSLDSFTTRVIGAGQELVVRAGGVCRFVTTHEGKPARPGVNQVQLVARVCLRMSVTSIGIPAVSAHHADALS